MKALYLLIVLSMINFASQPPKPEIRIGESIITIDCIWVEYANIAEKRAIIAQERADFKLACAYAKAIGGDPGPAPDLKK